MPQWTSDQVWQWMLESRGVPEGQHCLRCDGFGVYTYGTTSTWRHGVGGMTMTQDVCDRCWGSGRRDIAWPSHREQAARARQMREGA
jgi:hypothetical protein